jgi:hypothetical protein
LFIVPFPTAGGKWQVTSAGVDTFEWTPDGRRIVFEAPGAKMHSVDITAQGANVQIGAPIPIFGGESAPEVWTLAPDGRRILGAVVMDEGPTAPLVLVTDWSMGLGAP